MTDSIPHIAELDPVALGLRHIDKTSLRRLLRITPNAAGIVTIGRNHSAAITAYKTKTGWVELWTSRLFPGTLYRDVPDTILTCN